MAAFAGPGVRIHLPPAASLLPNDSAPGSKSAGEKAKGPVSSTVPSMITTAPSGMTHANDFLIPRRALRSTLRAADTPLEAVWTSERRDQDVIVQSAQAAVQ